MAAVWKNWAGCFLELQNGSRWKKFSTVLVGPGDTPFPTNLSRPGGNVKRGEQSTFHKSLLQVGGQTRVPRNGTSGALGHLPGAHLLGPGPGSQPGSSNCFYIQDSLYEIKKETRPSTLPAPAFSDKCHHLRLDK